MAAAAEDAEALLGGLHADYPFYSSEFALPAGAGSPFTIQTVGALSACHLPP